jgi:hypothetical protein
MVQILSRPSSGSLWIFVCGQDERFMLDIVNFANQIKISQNNADGNFMFFAPNAEGLINLLSSRKIQINNNVFKCEEFEEKIKLLKNISFLGCVVSSHGNSCGIESLSELKPAKLLKLLYNIQGLTDGLLLLGQCYSGIFNMPAQPNICVIGASNFCPSLSLSEPGCWIANTFLHSFAEWIRNPQDMDGDGHNTILDAYKYAACKTNDKLSNFKSKTFVNIQHAFKQLYALQSELIKPANSDNIELQAKYGIVSNNIKTWITNYHIMQESWISDMNTALRLIL